MRAWSFQVRFFLPRPLPSGVDESDADSLLRLAVTLVGVASLLTSSAEAAAAAATDAAAALVDAGPLLLVRFFLSTYEEVSVKIY